jgi:hypothetical protein
MIDFTAVWIEVQQKLFALLIIAALDFLLGVIIALKNGEFDWSRLTDYISSNGVPIVGWLSVEVLLRLPQELLPAGLEMVAFTAVYSTVALKLLASLLGHLSALGLLSDFLGKIKIPPTSS